MTLLNAALFFVFVCNLAFLVGAAFLLYRVVDAAEGSRAELKKAAIATIDAADKLHMVARRTINEMGLIHDAQAGRERSASRGIAELAVQMQSLTDRVLAEGVRTNSSGAAGDAGARRFSEDIRAKLRAELNAAVAKTHQLQEEIQATQYRLREAISANKELRTDLSEAKGIKQSTVDQLLQRAAELEAQLQLAQERAKAAELLAEANAMKLDDIKEQMSQSAEESRPAATIEMGGIDQSGLIQSQQDQIDMLAAREKALMGRMDQMEQAFERTRTEKTFIEERFLALDSTKAGD
jgi:hypothetical protein